MLIGLDLATRNRPYSIQAPVIDLYLEPWPDFARAARHTSSTSTPSDQSDPSAAAVLPSLPSLRPSPPVAVDPRTEPASETAAPALPPARPPRSRADAVGAGLALPHAWRGDVCRNPADFAAWQAARCGDRASSGRAESQGSDAAETAIGVRRGDAFERRRQDAFTRQKALNDRWLEYYRDRDAPYPGLLSLPSQM